MIPTILAGAAGILAAPVLGALAYRRARQRRIARTLVIDAPNAIVEDRFVRLGGVDQWIGIRGEDRDNPVVLVLHGGPGSPYSIFTPVMRAWERHFTVVQWDRRGVGKTLGRNGKAGCGALSFDRMALDAIELVEHLREHLGHERVIVLGCSMGNLVAAPLVRRRPDLCSVYVATDLPVDLRDEQHSYDVTLARLRAAGDRRGVAFFEAIGPDPSRWDVRAWSRKQRWVMQTDPVVRGLDRTLLMPLILTSPAHTLRDVVDVIAGLDFAAAGLFEEFKAHDARAGGTRFAVPFVLLQGDDDVFTSTALATAYFADVEAPRKEMALIAGAGHFAAFTRPEPFLAAMLALVRPLAARPARA